VESSQRLLLQGAREALWFVSLLFGNFESDLSEGVELESEVVVVLIIIASLGERGRSVEFCGGLSF